MANALQDYYQAVAEALDDWMLLFATAGTTNSVTLPALINTVPNASANIYDGHFVYNNTQNLQRHVRVGGFATSTGVMTVDPTWTTPINGDRIEVTRWFAIMDGQGPVPSRSYRQLVVGALRKYLTLDQLLIPIVPLQTAYPISPWSYWFDREERFGWPDKIAADGTHVPQPKIMEPGPTASAPPVPADWRRPRLRFDADIPYLELEAPFAAGTTGNLSVRVQRPSDTWCAFTGSGVWQESVTGPELPSDLARPPLSAIREIALADAYETLMNRGASSPSGVNWREKWLAQREIARGIHGYDWTQDHGAQQPTAQTPPAPVRAA